MKKKTYKAKRTAKHAGKVKTWPGTDLPIVDAIEDFPVIVRSLHEKHGVQLEPSECAAALAGKEQWKNGERLVDFKVYRSVAFAVLETKVVRYLTPRDLRDQILRFDAGHKFSTGAYIFRRIPEQVRNSRGKQHSPPDRPRGDPNSPHKRKPRRGQQDRGRPEFRFTKEAA